VKALHRCASDADVVVELGSGEYAFGYPAPPAPPGAPAAAVRQQ
jgi:hypothetical protein